MIGAASNTDTTERELTMIKRSILVMLVFTTTVAQAQIMGAGGPPVGAAANAAPRRTTALPSRHTGSQPLSRPKVAQPPAVEKLTPPRTQPPAAKPRSAQSPPAHQQPLQPAAKER